MRLALAIVSLAFLLVTLAAATFNTEAGSSGGSRTLPPSSGATSTLGATTPFGSPGDAFQSARVESTIWISGQFGRDERGWGDGSTDQARIAFRNLGAELERAGGSLHDVVELTTYHRDLDSIDEFRQIKAEVFGIRQPAWTAVEVTDLVEPESLVEIKATAVLGIGR